MPLIPGQPGPLNPFVTQTDKPVAKPALPLPFDPAKLPEPRLTAVADNTRVVPAGNAARMHAFLDEGGHLASAAPFGGVLKQGQQGAAVSELQGRLNALGYPAERTGVMDGPTADLLKRLQSDHGLTPTGDCDEKTMSTIQGLEQKHAQQQEAIDKLKAIKPSELHKLGVKHPKAFFKTLLPAALESERKYGAPAVMTLVQAAVESDFARSPIGGYNIFGIKNKGPAGTVKAKTREVINGKTHHVREPFAKFHNFYEAASAHGELYTKPCYKEAMDQYAKDKSVMNFIENIAPIYATDPNYANVLKNRIDEYDLLNLVKKNR